MNPTVTTEELLQLSKSADLLRQTAEKAMRFDEAERVLAEHIRSWGHIQEAMPEPDTLEPLVKRVIRRLGLVDSLKKELEVVGTHAICRLNVLGEIHRILGSDGGETGVNTLTGVPPQLYRLPKRVEQLVGELDKAKIDRDAWEDAANDWKERYHKEVAKNGELLRENETLARNMPPEPPADTPGRRPVFPSGVEVVTANKLGGPALNPDQFNAAQPTGFTKVLGQQWCKTDRAMTDLVNFAFKFDMQTHYIVLCNVHQDVQTGALTYHPVGVKDLPLVP